MKKRRIYSVFLVLFMCLLLLQIDASADIGPKPSVRISFVGDTEGEVIYATLLSEDEGGGPNRAYSKEQVEAYERELLDRENGSLTDGDTGVMPPCEAEWVKLAFMKYEDTDGFYYIDVLARIDEEMRFDWTYYPPDTFKLLLYYPRTDSFKVSGIYTRRAFDSYFTVDLSKGAECVYDEDKSGNDRYEEWILKEDYLFIEESTDGYLVEARALILRMIFTVLIELILAVLFGFFSLKSIGYIALMNTVTQLLLNGMLYLCYFAFGSSGYGLYYFLLEVSVTMIEAAAYCYLFGRRSELNRPYPVLIIYAIVANAVSYFASVPLGVFFAEIF